MDPRANGELPDLHIAMGETAENVARWCGVSRAEQDEFAVRSQNLRVVGHGVSSGRPAARQRGQGGPSIAPPGTYGKK